MNNYMFSVTRSSHCCAVYELAGLAPNVIDSGFIEAVKAKAKSAGEPKVLPLLIQFSDKDGGFGIGNSKGEDLHELLIKEGYKCDRFKLGLNPKSHNNVSLYNWWTHKGKGGVSKVREYEYNKEKQSVKTMEPGSGEPGAASSRGAGLGGRRRVGNYLRLGRRAGTRL